MSTGQGSQEAVDPTNPADVLGSPESRTFRQVLDDGFAQTADVVLYPGVDARDAELLSTGWTSVGGTGSIPCSFDQTSYVVFGTLTVFNEIVDGFTSPDQRWSFASGWDGAIRLGNEKGPPMMTLSSRMGIEYSSGSECRDTGGLLTAPKMNGDQQWGPAPIAIIFSGVYTPRYPSGHEELFTPMVVCQGFSPQYADECMSVPPPSKNATSGSGQ